MVMALEGIRVVDMTVWHHGPGGGTFLADMGAEVIKVEERQSGDPGRHSQAGIDNDIGLSYYFENNNRDKKGLAINLKTEKGHEVITRLLKKSDIFLSNFRKPALGRLGLSYKDVKGINPDIIYAHGSGQGAEGPLSSRQSNDIIGQFGVDMLAMEVPKDQCLCGLILQTAVEQLCWDMERLLRC